MIIAHMYVVPFSHPGGTVVRHGGVAAVCDKYITKHHLKWINRQ